MGSHTLQHVYGQGFYIILVEIYEALSLTPVSVGLLQMTRQLATGLTSMGGGVIIDRMQHRRISILYGSLIAMGSGYLLVGLAPSFVIIVAAAGLAGAAGSIWHPAALSLLSQRYPEQRGFMIALHRSAGSVGDTIGPVLIGALLLVVAWQWIVYAALPITLLFALGLWRVLRNAESWQTFKVRSEVRRPIGEQLGALRGLFRSRALILLLAVSALAGIGQGGLLLWLALYLANVTDMSILWVGIHVAMLTGIGIVTGPLIGRLSDRLGRKPVIVGVLAAKATIAALMGLAGSGPFLSILIFLIGTVMFGVNSLIQAGALDLAHGRKLEGTMLGLLWGSNAVFVGAGPLVLGALIQAIGFGVLFWYVAATNLVAVTAALWMPPLDRPPVAAPSR